SDRRWRRSFAEPQAIGERLGAVRNGSPVLRSSVAGPRAWRALWRIVSRLALPKTEGSRGCGDVAAVGGVGKAGAVETAAKSATPKRWSLLFRPFPPPRARPSPTPPPKPGA